MVLRRLLQVCNINLHCSRMSEALSHASPRGVSEQILSQEASKIRNVNFVLLTMKDYERQEIIAQVPFQTSGHLWSGQKKLSSLFGGNSHGLLFHIPSGRRSGNKQDLCGATSYLALRRDSGDRSLLT